MLRTVVEQDMRCLYVSVARECLETSIETCDNDNGSYLSRVSDPLSLTLATVEGSVEASSSSSATSAASESLPRGSSEASMAAGSLAAASATELISSKVPEVLISPKVAKVLLPAAEVIAKVPKSHPAAVIGAGKVGELLKASPCESSPATAPASKPSSASAATPASASPGHHCVENS